MGTGAIPLLRLLPAMAIAMATPVIGSLGLPLIPILAAVMLSRLNTCLVRLWVHAPALRITVHCTLSPWKQ